MMNIFLGCFFILQTLVPGKPIQEPPHFRPIPPPALYQQFGPFVDEQACQGAAAILTAVPGCPDNAVCANPFRSVKVPCWCVQPAQD